MISGTVNSNLTAYIGDIEVVVFACCEQQGTDKRKTHFYCGGHANNIVNGAEEQHTYLEPEGARTAHLNHQ